jgi:hypothetical protein
MKIGDREYTEQEAVTIEVYKSHIKKLQKEIDDHWNILIDLVGDNKKQHEDYLWDYVMNDFNGYSHKRVYNKR